MKIKSLTLLSLLLLLPLEILCKDFVVVIDAGHGGKDPGSIGRKGREKNINLSVALKVGALISQSFNDVTVKYTRSTDKFVALGRRAEIANNANADLFISIHTNALPRRKSHFRGTETYTLGLARTKENLEVAQQENSVILIEEDYKERYAGFNPRSAESYIIFEFIQDNNMKESVELAKLIQSQFRRYANRVDRGVKQAGFLVLRQTTMPSVLVELGYISNPDEERYLLSKSGQDALARSICQAFVAYRKGVGHGTRPNPAPAVEAPPNDDDLLADDEPTAGRHIDDSSVEGDIVFKIQIMATPTRLKPNDKSFKGLGPVSFYKEGKLYKYTVGSSRNPNEMQKELKQVSRKFKGAFIVAFKGDKKVDYQKAVQESRRRR
ncbi:MAG: N-acetylmuramoyl-L-alanine amidase [Bacteroidales bacterium]|nr:N-acetylmuramoyl-L-alanine amidase [Bacteroidales bacterium]